LRLASNGGHVMSSLTSVVFLAVMSTTSFCHSFLH
jgi:hypothetical protein